MPFFLYSQIWFIIVDGKKPLGVEDFNETPKTDEEVRLLEINWAVFDQHEVHEKMRFWITNKVMELLKTEKANVVEQVVDCIRKQNLPSQMLQLLEFSLDVHTETVVRILWRTLLILHFGARKKCSTLRRSVKQTD